MRALIVYAGTYGFTAERVEELKAGLKGDVTVADAGGGSLPSPEDFDTVIIGGAVYMGQISKKLKEYCSGHAGALQNKRLGLFLCCGLPENFQETLKNNFSESLIEKAISAECLGGELRTERMSLPHKLITKAMKKAAKPGTPDPCAVPENLKKMVERINDESL